LKPCLIFDTLVFNLHLYRQPQRDGCHHRGKTTVLRMLMALELVDEGMIYVDGTAMMTHLPRCIHRHIS